MSEADVLALQMARLLVACGPAELTDFSEWMYSEIVRERNENLSRLQSVR